MGKNNKICFSVVVSTWCKNDQSLVSKRKGWFIHVFEVIQQLRGHLNICLSYEVSRYFLSPYQSPYRCSQVLCVTYESQGSFSVHLWTKNFEIFFEHLMLKHTVFCIFCAMLRLYRSLLFNPLFLVNPEMFSNNSATQRTRSDTGQAKGHRSCSA